VPDPAKPEPRPSGDARGIGGPDPRRPRSRWGEARERLIVTANLCLILLYPAAWLAPLAEAGVLPWFGGESITILGAVEALWQNDPALAGLVGLFAIAIPYAKTTVLAAVHFGYLRARAVIAVEIVGKLSMADVFLIALYIVISKGVGLGYVTSAWGLWLFTGCVLASLWIGHATRRRLA